MSTNDRECIRVYFKTAKNQFLLVTRNESEEEMRKQYLDEERRLKDREFEEETYNGPQFPKTMMWGQFRKGRTQGYIVATYNIEDLFYWVLNNRPLKAMLGSPISALIWDKYGQSLERVRHILQRCLCSSVEIRIRKWKGTSVNLTGSPVSLKKTESLRLDLDMTSRQGPLDTEIYRLFKDTAPSSLGLIGIPLSHNTDWRDLITSKLTSLSVSECSGQEFSQVVKSLESSKVRLAELELLDVSLPSTTSTSLQSITKLELIHLNRTEMLHAIRACGPGLSTVILRHPSIPPTPGLFQSLSQSCPDVKNFAVMQWKEFTYADFLSLRRCTRRLHTFSFDAFCSVDLSEFSDHALLSNEQSEIAECVILKTEAPCGEHTAWNERMWRKRTWYNEILSILGV